MDLAFAEAEAAGLLGEVPIGAVVVSASRRGVGTRRQPHASASRSDGPCRAPRHSRGLRQARQRAAHRLRPLRHARALRHVRRGYLLRAASQALFRCTRPKGRRRRAWPALLCAAHLPSRARNLWRHRRGKSRRAPEGLLRRAAVVMLHRSQKHRLPVPRAANGFAKLTNPGFHPRRVLEDPRGRIALLLPAESGRGLATPPVCVPPASSGAASLIPRSRRSAARVLMDEGWSEFNRGARGGDNKRCRVGKAKRAHHRLGGATACRCPPTAQARGTAPRPVWRTRRALPRAHRSCRSRRCGRGRTRGCASRS